MSFNESARFPLQIAFGAQGGPGYSTNIVPMDSGFESRNVNWSASRAKYEVGLRAMGKADTDALLAFFRVVKGRAHGFRFRDWSDYRVGAGEGIVIQTAAGLQLAKLYASGDLQEARPISKPAGTVILSAGTVDYATGLVTGGSLSSTWTGEFDIPVRFDTDEMKLDAIDKSQGDILFQWGQIPIIEIRV
jgi:uncharacterized protein (TIGR02217 family)